jgi:hypothetical protein
LVVLGAIQLLADCAYAVGVEVRMDAISGHSRFVPVDGVASPSFRRAI